ncbi:MAG: hypothetical protein HQL82_11790 [Magnetococcales bacterium]|nr:hypothetical protein [Magnetococcales bacterium]
MPNLPIAQISPGMIVDSDVRDLSGRLLLGKGQEVTAKHLLIFKTWGVAEIDVRAAAPKATPVPTAPPAAAPPGGAGDVAPEILAEAGRFFQLNDPAHPAIRILFDQHIKALQQAAETA